MHYVEDLIHIFNDCFFYRYQTRLELGGDEPWYLPQNSERPYHVIQFAHGFFSSALHEIAHWLLAGPARRMREDYGYWYEPDGRNMQQQRLFEQVEVKPQAMEWILSEACAFKFHYSLDNLHGEVSHTTGFRNQIAQQAQHYCRYGLPLRAQQFREKLCEFYKQPLVLCIEKFQVDEE